MIKAYRKVVKYSRGGGQAKALGSLELQFRDAMSSKQKSCGRENKKENDSRKKLTMEEDTLYPG